MTDDNTYVNARRSLNFIYIEKPRSAVQVYPGSKLANNPQFKQALGCWAVAASDNPKDAILKVFLMICQTYTLNKQEKRRQGAPVEGRELDAIKHMSAPSCIPCHITPSFNSTIRVNPIVYAQAAFVDVFAAVLCRRYGYDSIPCPLDQVLTLMHADEEEKRRLKYIGFQPLYCSHKQCRWVRNQLKRKGTPLRNCAMAMVNGGTAAGIVKALKKSLRFKIRPSVPTDVLALAYMDILRQIPPLRYAPLITEETIDLVSFKADKSAGYLNVKPEKQRFEGSTIRYVNTATQGEAAAHCRAQCKAELKRVRNGIDQKIYDPGWFNFVLNKNSIKSVVMGEDDDKDKSRVVFQAPMEKLLIDKVLFEEFVKNTYQRANVMIGHTWKRGGARHLANKLGWARKDMKIFTFDIIGFDQAAFAAIIELIILMPFMSLPKEDTEAYKIYRAMMYHSAHEMAVKVIKWLDHGAMMIIGQVFSGRYTTSWIGSIYVQLMIKCCFIIAYDYIHKQATTQMAEDFRYCFISMLQYGDDTVIALPAKFFDIVCADRTPAYPLGDFQRNMKEYCGLEFKPSQVAIFDSIFTEIRLKRVELPEKKAGHALRYEIVKEGPVFLKRQWVKMKIGNSIQIMPWRRESDYYVRLAVSASATCLEPAKFLSKYLGLMIDTMGTNIVAYEICREMFVFASNRDSIRNPTTENIKLRTSERPKYSEINKMFTDISMDVLDEIDEDEEQLSKSLMKTGLNLDQLPLAMNRTKLLQMFVWDEKWRNAWAFKHGIPLYDDYGNEVKPVWNDMEVDAGDFISWTGTIEYDLETTIGDLIEEFEKTRPCKSGNWADLADD